MKPTLLRNVLFLQASDGMHSVRRRNAVERIAVANGWVLRSSRYAVDECGGCLLRRAKDMLPFQSMARKWSLDGVILECDEARYGRMSLTQFGTLPTVLIDPGAPPRGRHRSAVMRDESAIGAIAARELLESGYASYAFVPCFDDPLWSRDRGKGFAAIIGAAGLRIAVCAAGAQALASMPKPIGVFVANDIAAADVLRVCRELGLRVPETVAVIGVDDERNLCESVKPTLSSIAIDWEREGEAAMRLLTEMLDAPRVAFPPRKCCFAAVVRRESTRFDAYGDARLRRGLEFIRLKACEGIVPNDVAKAMFVSLTLAKRLFRRKAGTTILAEIHAVRLAKAKEMLASGMLPDIVAQECGYGSVNDFRRVFKRRIGTTIRHWLKNP